MMKPTPKQLKEHRERYLRFMLTPPPLKWGEWSVSTGKPYKSSPSIDKQFEDDYYKHVPLANSPCVMEKILGRKTYGTR